jgi:predicted Zn finger-like uncharacterized protein
MLIVCNTCASSYHIPREILGENGCLLRCVGCGEAWTVTPEAMGAGALAEPMRVAPEVWHDAREGFHPAAPLLSDHAWRETGSSASARKPVLWPFLARKAKGAAALLAAMAIIGAAMGALAARAAVVRAVPGAARIFAAVGLPVNLRGLALDNVRTNIFDLGDKKMLVVEGSIVNLRDSATEAPNMRIALRGADKRELYVWTAPTPKAKLAANEQVAFRTRLAAPPEGVSDVIVRFASGADKVLSMQGLIDARSYR